MRHLRLVMSLLLARTLFIFIKTRRRDFTIILNILVKIRAMRMELIKL